MNANLSIVQAILLLAGGLIVYFIPNWVANARKHHNANAIFVTNLFLGWTFIGWVASIDLVVYRCESQDTGKHRKSVRN